MSGFSDEVRHAAYSLISRLLTNDSRLDGHVMRISQVFFGLGSHLAVQLQFGHVMDNAVQLPLRVDLGLGAQREAA